MLGVTIRVSVSPPAGIPLAQVHGRLRHWLETQASDYYLLMENDDALARIIAEEIRQVVNLPVSACAMEITIAHLWTLMPSKDHVKSSEVYPPWIERVLSQDGYECSHYPASGDHTSPDRPESL
jgi:hypothetical protein